MSSGRDPAVSVCLPVYNSEAWVERAIESALSQSYGDLEVVVVDNASTDDTVGVIERIGDPRIRLFRNSENLGVCRNFDRTISLARGRYLKFLCSDDEIYPDCVEAMVGVCELEPQIGLVFSPRDIVLEDPDDAEARTWKAKHERSHECFGELEAVNSGDELLRRWIADSFASNWIGEPSNVMMTRECVRLTGGFHQHMPWRNDMDLWARAMLFGPVGYVDRALANFRVRAGSLSSSHRDDGKAWLDKLWLLEGLLTYDGARKRFPELVRLRRRAALSNARKLLLSNGTPSEGKFASIGDYVRFRLTGGGDQSRVYGALDESSGFGGGALRGRHPAAK